jgi:hypothetical protein
VTLGLDKAFIRASSGLPILAPEIALLYKSRDLDAKNWARFHAALPALDAEQRAWLQAALTRLDPAHPWLPALDVGDTPAG